MIKLEKQLWEKENGVISRRDALKYGGLLFGSISSSLFLSSQIALSDCGGYEESTKNFYVSSKMDDGLSISAYAAVEAILGASTTEFEMEIQDGKFIIRRHEYSSYQIVGYKTGIDVTGSLNLGDELQSITDAVNDVLGWIDTYLINTPSDFSLSY